MDTAFTHWETDTAVSPSTLQCPQTHCSVPRHTAPFRNLFLFGSILRHPSFATPSHVAACHCPLSATLSLRSAVPLLTPMLWVRASLSTFRLR